MTFRRGKAHSLHRGPCERDDRRVRRSRGAAGERVERRKRRETARKAGRGRGARRRMTRAIPPTARAPCRGRKTAPMTIRRSNPMSGRKRAPMTIGRAKRRPPLQSNSEKPQVTENPSAAWALSARIIAHGCPFAPRRRIRSRDDGEEGEIPRPSFGKEWIYAFRNSATLFAASRPEFTWLPDAEAIRDGNRAESSCGDSGSRRPR